MRICFVVVICIIFCGCGTIANLSLPPENLGPRPMTPTQMNYYGGVTIDVSYTLLSGFILLPFTIIDIPLSVVGDTLTIPVVAIAKRIDSAKWKSTSFEFQSNKYEYQIPSSEIIKYSLTLEYTLNDEAKTDRVTFASMTKEGMHNSAFFYTQAGVKCKSTPQYISITFPFALDDRTTVTVRYKQK